MPAPLGDFLQCGTANLSKGVHDPPLSHTIYVVAFINNNGAKNDGEGKEEKADEAVDWEATHSSLTHMKRCSTKWCRLGW